MQTKNSKSTRFLSLLAISTTIILSVSVQTLNADEIREKKEPVKTEKENPVPDKSEDKNQPNRQVEKLKKWVQKNPLPIEPIIKEMERAGQLIGEQDQSEEVQRVQKQVVQDLEKLIRLVEQAPKTTMRLQNQNNQQQQEQQQKRQDREGMQKQNNDSQLSQGPARQSTDRQNEGQATSGNLSDKNNYAKDAWGHLPPAMRQQLLNIYTEKFLPQYEDQVRRYYEALAEKKKRTP
ncbi:MAG: hypothetical protein KDA70_00945 [Planctomycetaceae bacterium]|nr:hypothetical protein [Planctomycetaceae bacterium]